MNRKRGLRVSLAGLIVLIAICGLGINAMRPKTTKIVELKVGTGPAVKAGDTVKVHYVARFSDGKIFDSSKFRGEPFTVKIGIGQLIRGWDIGMIGMRAGGIRDLNIPPHEAYGEKGVPGSVPPNETLDFEVELLRINP